MKKVKKMAIGGMGTSSAVKSAPQAFQSAGMNVNLPTGQRGFSSSPTMGSVGNQLKPANPNIQKINTSPPPPGTPALQRFSTPGQYKQAEAAYKKMQQQQQLVNSVGKLPQANDLGQVGSQLATPISGAGAKALGLGIKKGGAVKMKSGGKTSSASKRADGCATKGKTRGRMV